MAFMNLTPLGVAFTDLVLSNLGSASFELDHDWFTRQDLAIRTAAGGGGTLLVEGTHYTLATESSYLSSVVTQAVGETRNIFHSITITAAQYQSVTLYFSGKYIADSNDAVDVPYTAIKNVSAAYTVRDGDKVGTLCTTTGASDVTHILPTLADNIGREVDFVKLDSGAGEVVIDGEGSEPILWPGGSGLTCRVGLQNQHCKVKAFSDGWRIVAGVVQPVAGEPDIGGGWHFRVTRSATLIVEETATSAGVWSGTVTIAGIPTGASEVECMVTGSMTGGTVLSVERASGVTLVPTNSSNNWRRYKGVRVAASGGYNGGMVAIPLDGAGQFKWATADSAGIQICAPVAYRLAL